MISADTLPWFARHETRLVWRDWAWLLSGGLDPANVAEAIAQTGARGVDVSSGVERAPGLKDEAKIAAFVAAARVGLAHDRRSPLNDRAR